MPTLQEFIADCIAQAAGREQRLQDLIRDIVSDVRLRLGESIPQPLRQFTSFAGVRPSEEVLRTYPTGFSPSEFKIEAPGLQTIRFSVSALGPESPFFVRDIQVAGSRFSDFIEAVAFAASDPVTVAEIKPGV
jgi:hypothetical protein